MDNSEQNISIIQQVLLYLPDKAAKDLNLTGVMEYHVVRVAEEIIVDLIEKADDVTYQIDQMKCELKVVNRLEWIL